MSRVEQRDPGSGSGWCAAPAEGVVQALAGRVEVAGGGLAGGMGVPWRPGRRPWDHTTSRGEGSVVWQGLAAQRRGFGLQPYHVTAMQTLGLEKGYPLYGNDVHERWVGTRARLRGRHSGSEVVSNVTVSEGHIVGKMAVAYAESFPAGPGIRLLWPSRGGRGWRRPQRPRSSTRRTCGSGPRRQDAVGTL